MTLSGTKLFVHDDHTADAIVVAARTGGSGEQGISLFLVPRDARGLEVLARRGDVAGEAVGHLTGERRGGIADVHDGEVVAQRLEIG